MKRAVMYFVWSLLVATTVEAQTLGGIFPPFQPPTIDIFAPAVNQLTPPSMTTSEPQPPQCQPTPHRDVTVFDMTVSALVETEDCGVYLSIFNADQQTMYLLDLINWRYQTIPNFMPGHQFTAIESIKREPFHLILKDRTGFWGWRWPLETLPWVVLP